MIQRLLKLTLLITLFGSLLVGCGYKDIDKRFFAIAIGVDYIEDEEEKPFLITLALAVPSTKIEPKSAITQIETIQTNSIADGIRLIKSKLDKELDMGHCKVIIMGEALANHDISDVVYWIARRRDIQNIATLSIGKPTAGEIIKVQPASDRFPGNTLSFFFSEDTTESSYMRISTFTDVYKRLKEPGLDPILPIISAEEDKTYVVNSLALLDKQKVKIVLSPKETQLFNQLSKNLSHMSIYGSYEFEKVTMALTNIRIAYKIDEYATQPAINMHVKQSVIIEEIPPDKMEEGEIVYDKLIQEAEQAYSKESIALFEKIREEKLDPYGFGLRYRAHHPLKVEQFEEVWPELYENVTFNVTTKINLKSTGLIK